MGVEPTCQAWEACILPMNYSRIFCCKNRRKPAVRGGMASPARFERAAFRLGGERSILLSYRDLY